MVRKVTVLIKFPDKIGFKKNGPIAISAHNETCIHWSEGSVVGNNSTQHIDLSKQFVQNECQQGILNLTKIDSELTGADLLTKPFTVILIFKRLCKHLMGY